MPSSYTPAEQNYLLSLARRVIEHYLEFQQKLKISVSKLPSEQLKEKRGVFVSLHLNHDLRGCIGRIEPTQSLYLNVIDNAQAAAFADPRFPPLAKHELKKILIEISVLTQPQKLVYQNAPDLLSKLKPNQDGLIIKKNFNQATFLPQVWQQLPIKVNFLSHLCAKAGLPANSWQTGDLEIFTYQAEIFGE